MEIEQMCVHHVKQKISWVCLEKNCSQRVMCSTCAVKVHDRQHKLEELSNLFDTGILQAYQSNLKNNSLGLKLLVSGDPELNKIEELNQEDSLAQSIERYLKQVAKKIDSTRKDLINKQEEIRIKNENERQKILEDLQQFDQRLINSEDLSVEIDKAFLHIGQYVNKKESENLHNKEAEILSKKIQLLGVMKENFLKMIKAYFHNQFTAEFCQLFDVQLETLNQREVQDTAGFLDYVDGKWKQDYKNIQYAIERFVVKLNEALKQTISLPLDEKPKQIVQPYKSPSKQPKQQQFYPATPFGQPVFYPQQVYFYQQQPQQVVYPFQSPKVYDQENHPDHFATSQILYDDPNQKKNIRIEPVSQSLQYQ
ncbi:hypothetical protein pb186bvf_000366 [Paramecium bursaria]